jgi:hypothetical protein
MDEVNQNKEDSLSKELKQFFSNCGKVGGKARSERKAIAARKNGQNPCRPGKKRGRPFKIFKDQQDGNGLGNASSDSTSK